MRLKLLIGAVILAGLPYMAAWCIYLFVASGLSGPLPTKKALKQAHRPLASVVYAADSTVFGKIYVENRSETEFSQFPSQLLDALIATEDIRFYQHHGVDYRSLGRVFVKGLLMFRSAGGGSTISQQLAKNLYPRREYFIAGSLVHKVREIIVARRIERVYSKEEILENYLNTVSFGEHAHGIRTASKRFFNKIPKDLSYEEAATLVGILKAPTYYSPRRSPERALARRNVVLAQMSKYGMIHPEFCDSLQSLPLVLNYTRDSTDSRFSGYFLTQVQKQAQQILDELASDNSDALDVRTSGLSIYTTIDPHLQRHAEAAISKQMPNIQRRFDNEWSRKADWETAEWITAQVRELPAYNALIAQGLSSSEARKSLEQKGQLTVFSWDDKKRERSMNVIDSILYYKRILQTGLFAIDPNTGYIKAWIGGVDHRYFPFDRVLAKRPPGSTFKPLVYAAALEAGVDPCHYYDNTRRVFEEYENWSPGNANETYGGSYSLTGSLAYSINSVAVQVLEDAGIDETIDLARRVGIESHIPSVPSIALGTSDIRLDELTRAYCSFANGGRNVNPVSILKIVDRFGNLIYEYIPPVSQTYSMSDTVARTLFSMLELAVNAGTASGLRSTFGLRIPLAGKTGTTQNNADGWFIGIAPDLVTGVWVGADDPRVHFKTLSSGQGSRTAMHIFGQFASNVSRDPAFGAWHSHRFYPGSTDQVRFGDCPPHSALTAAEMEEYLDMTHAGEENVSVIVNILESLFAPRPKTQAEFEHKILSQMQRKLDRTVVIMKKQGKRPTEIRRKLAEIRKEHFLELEKLRNKEDI